jgi:hypothetical protein
MAEIAGAMGVDLLVSGSLAQVGKLAVLNLLATDTTTSRATASVSETVEGGVEAVVRRVPVVVRHLLERARLVGPGATPLAQPEPPPVPAAPAAAPHAEPQKSRMPLIAGALAAAASAPSMLVAVGLGGLALGVLILPTLVGIPTAFPLDTKKRLLLGSGSLLGVLGLGAGAAAVVLLLGGAAALGMGWMP